MTSLRPRVVVGAIAIAIALVAVALVLAVKLFLWEIYSPEYGFRMPWLQTELPAAAREGRAA